MTHDEPGREYQTEFYSQFGEDAVLAWLFHGRNNGFYVDVGCHHPFRISNTAALHTRQGWTGLNIDVDQRAIDAFNVHRPSDINICAGIGAVSGRAEVTIFDEGAINTFSATSAAHPAWAGIARTTKWVDVHPLEKILSAHLPEGRSIDLLDVDAESLDLDVLRSNDWTRFRPEVVVVEMEGAHLDNLSGSPTYNFLHNVGYRIVSFVAISAIFKRS